MDDDVYVRIDFFHAIASAFSFTFADVTLAMNNLALKVRLVDRIELHNSQRAHTSGCKIHKSRRAESTRTNAEDFGILEALLSRHSHVRNDQVAAIATHLIDRKCLGRGHQRWKALRHIYSSIDLN